MKTKALLLCCLIAAVLIASPASAAFEKFSIDVNQLPDVQATDFEGTYIDFNPYEDEKCIAQIRFTVPANSHADFVIYDYDQEIVGSLNVSDEGLNRVFRWSLGSESYEYGRLKVLSNVDGAYWIRCFTDSIYNSTVTETMYVGLQEYFRGDTGIAFAELNAVPYRIAITSTEPMAMRVWTVPTETLYSAKKKQTDQVTDLVGQIGAMVEGTSFTISFAWGVFTKLFIENFASLCALYVSVTGAIAVCTKRDIFKAIETWIGYQISLINFMLSMLDFIIGIITKIVGALKPF